MLTILITKILALVALIISTLLALTVPSCLFYYWKKRRKSSNESPEFEGSSSGGRIRHNKTYVELLRSFDCGMLLSSLFLHLMPIARKNFDIFFIRLRDTSYKKVILIRDVSAENFEYRGVPCVELMICLSFFSIYFCEELVQICLKYRKYYWFNTSGQDESNFIYNTGFNWTNYEFPSLDYRLKKTKDYLITCSSRKTSQTTSSSRNGEISNHQPSSLVNFETHSDITPDSLQDAPISLSSESSESSESNTSLESPSYWQETEKRTIHVFLPHLTLAASMPVHSILEGMVIASQENASLIWMMFSVILLHKIISAFVLSTEIAFRTRCKVMPTTMLITFSLLPSVGFLIVILTNILFCSALSKAVTVMIFTCLSAGAILHIVLLCIRQNRFSSSSLKNGILQHFTMYSGFVFILACTLSLNGKIQK